jgi:hypothetical protein
MSYCSEDALEKIRKQPRTFSELWDDITTRQQIRSALGFDLWKDVSDDGWLTAYATLTAYQLTTYGPEPSGPYPALESILRWPTMACDVFCHVALQLFTLARPSSPIVFRRIGWAGPSDEVGAVLTPPSPSPVGNHAQLVVCSGATQAGTALLLDPTIGAIAKVRFPQFLEGARSICYHRMGTGPHPRTATDFGEQFPLDVKSALQNGLFRPEQLIYYQDVKQVITYTEAPLDSSWSISA